MRGCVAVWDGDGGGAGDGQRCGGLRRAMLMLGEELLQLRHEVCRGCRGQAAHESALALLGQLGLGDWAVCWQSYLQPACEALQAATSQIRTA